LEVGEVGDHERVARRGWELLHDADDVEGDDAEAAARPVEDAELQEVAGSERVVADRLPRDEDSVRSRAQPIEDLRSTSAEEVGVAQGRPPRERGRVDAERVLKVRPDVRIRVVD